MPVIRAARSIHAAWRDLDTIDFIAGYVLALTIHSAMLAWTDQWIRVGHVAAALFIVAFIAFLNWFYA